MHLTAKANISKQADLRRLVIQILDALLTTAHADFKGVKSEAPESPKIKQGPLSAREPNQSLLFASGSINFGNGLNMQATFSSQISASTVDCGTLLTESGHLIYRPDEMPLQRKLSSFVDCCQDSQHATQQFQRTDLVGLTTSKALVEIITQFVGSKLPTETDKGLIQGLLGTVIDIILDFKNRETYDVLSLQLTKGGVFGVLIPALLETPIERPDFKNAARIFELCACHSDGIKVLSHYLAQIVSHCNRFLQKDNDMITVKYPAATVLLDLTANELCIERVAILIKNHDILRIVIEELELSLQRRIPKTGPNRVYFSRYRDLMIGIILNLTCNVENDEVTQYMLKLNVVSMLKKILVDSRHDWPTNGAALAILQYSHGALSSSDMFLILEENHIYAAIVEFIGVCKNKETKRHLYEASQMIQMARTKMASIVHIYTKQLFAAGA